MGLFGFLKRFKKQPPAPSAPRLPTVHELVAGLPDTEQGRLLHNHIVWAEQAYDGMYEGRGSPSGSYSDMKEHMSDAIRIARELGLAEKAAQLERVRDHRRKVFRSQLS